MSETRRGHDGSKNSEREEKESRQASCAPLCRCACDPCLIGCTARVLLLLTAQWTAVLGSPGEPIVDTSNDSHLCYYHCYFDTPDGSCYVQLSCCATPEPNTVRGEFDPQVRLITMARLTGSFFNVMKGLTKFSGADPLLFDGWHDEP